MLELVKPWEDLTTADPSMKGPIYGPKLKNLKKPQIYHHYSSRSKTQAAPLSTKSVEFIAGSEQRGFFGIGQWASNLVGAVKDATV